MKATSKKNKKYNLNMLDRIKVLSGLLMIKKYVVYLYTYFLLNCSYIYMYI